MRKNLVVMTVMTLLALSVGALWSWSATRRPRDFARRAATATTTAHVRKPLPGIGGIVLPPSRPVYGVAGALTSDVKVVAEPSAQQWARHLRDKVCDCSAAACAINVQHVYARSVENLDFGSGDRAETDRLMHEAADCTSKLIDAEYNSGPRG